MNVDIKQPEISSAPEWPLLDEIENRRSLRAYSDRPVEEEKIRTLFEAARWAPSSMNEQPWVYLYAEKDHPELWQRIFDTLNDSNKVWVKNAPLLIVSLVRKNFTRFDKPNGSARYDLGAANALLSVQATALGLNVHQMGGYDKEKARTNLHVPDEYELGVVMAVGYPGSPDSLPEHLKQRELALRVRYRQSEFVFNNMFE